MNPFSSALKAFQNSQISLAELLAYATKLTTQPDSAVNAVRTLLTSEYQAGQLPAEAYFALMNALDDATRVADTNQPHSPLSSKSHNEEETLLAPKTKATAVKTAPSAVSLPDTTQPQSTLSSKSHDKDETLLAPKAEATEVKTAPSAVSLPDTTQPHSTLSSKSHDKDGTLLAPKAEATEVKTASPTGSLLDTQSLLRGLNESHEQSPISVGSILKNRFVLEDLLGVGGMGMVFKAKDLRKVEAVDKEPYVALKVLNQDFQADPIALVALQRETKRAQTLSHPNIIKVYDFDRDGAHVFMTMEYLQGRPLSHVIKEHAADGLPYKKAWPIIRAMAEALGHAHKKNIVHSDFKPGNVIIDAHGEVRVLDFGIACAINRGDKDHQDATVFNARTLGALTPAYASLEQLQNRDPEPHDDIYALACVTYELLTGKHPFGRLSAEKAREVNIQAKPIAKLSRRQWKGLQKALSFEKQRTASIEEFLAGIGPRSKMFYGIWGAGIIGASLFAANIYLSVIAPPTIIDAPKVTVKLSPEQQQKIKDLIELAGIHADVGYLTAPTGSNALWAYQEALKIDPYNQQAIDGMIKIADILEQQAWEAYEKNDRAAAMKKVQEGLEAYPSHKGLLSLKEKLRASS